MIVLQGMRSSYTQGAPSGNVPPFFRVLGSKSVAGIPINVIILFVLAIVFSLVLSKSAFGRQVYITGGNPVTARLVGIKSDRVVITYWKLRRLPA